MNGEKVETLWPGAAVAVDAFAPAERKAALDRATVAFVWDYVFRGDEIFPALREGLSAAYPSIRFVDYEVFGSTFGGEEHSVVANLPQQLREHGVDLAISGVGCCGACTPAVMRASASMERAGVPTASLVCEGFAGQGRAVSAGLGCPALPLAILAGHVDSLSSSELRRMIRGDVLPQVITCLTESPANHNSTPRIYEPYEVVARGSFEEINQIYIERAWSDGLPIVPPTQARVEAFLSQTPDAPGRIIGVVQPSGAGMSIHSVAVNGVMAGCRPEYMPILVALAEVMADPGYGVEHSGDTTGADPLIILNGPIIRRLNFNRENGALRDGAQPNGTVGRFLRLLLRNVVGLLPGGGDKSTFGHSARVVLAEHEEELAKLGWSSFAVRAGFEANDNVVTVGRFTGDTVVGSMYGHEPEALARYLADGLVRQSGWELVFAAGLAPGTHRPLVVISPMIAKTLAKSGVDPRELQRLLFRYARIPAHRFEDYIGTFSNLVPGRRTLGELVSEGLASKQFAETSDPHRLVPIVDRPEDILVVVSGDSYRSNAMVFGSNGMHGFPTSKRIAAKTT